MRAKLELPRLSIAERDRRYALVREEMRRRRIDCLFLCGWPLMYDFYTANARYLCPVGGNSGYNMLVFPLEAEPTCFVWTPVGIEYWHMSQEWVPDLRARKGGWGDTIANRIRELKLDKGTIGVDGLGGPMDPDGWMPQGMYEGLKNALPQATIASIGDMMEQCRAIKSAEEIAVLDQASRLGDLMVEALRDHARPGVPECMVYGKMREVMVGNGGEEPTLFFWCADKNPLPHAAMMPTTRKLEKGDVIIFEIHPKFGGYCTHIERTFVIGQPASEYVNIYDGCLAAYRKGMEHFGPGRKIADAMNAVGELVKSRGLGVCELGIHGHGLGSIEHPRYRLHALAADKEAIKSLSGLFEPGMVFAFNIDLFDPKFMGGNTGCTFAETIVITETGARRMHNYPLELQIIDA